MKIFANANIWKKILIIIGIFLLATLISPKPVEALGNKGGTLMSPVMSLLMGLSDGLNAIIQSFFLDKDPTIYLVTTGIKWGRIVLGLVIGAGLILGSIITGGTLSVALAIGGITTIGVGLVSSGALDNALGDSLIYQVTTAITSSLLSSKDEIALPDIELTPYEIFSNKGDIFSVNVFREDNTASGTDNRTIISTMRQAVRNWYKTLRLIAIVGMMAVLVYVGIRILLSSTAESKARYKQMLWDWVVAICLVYVIHFIMIFSNLLVESITEVIDTIEVKTTAGGTTTTNWQGVEGFVIGADPETGDIDTDKKTKELVEEAYNKLIEDKDGNVQETAKLYKSFFWKDLSGTRADSADDAQILFWPANNFTVQSRMAAQIVKKAGGEGYQTKYIGYVLIYVMLTIYTCMFIFVYLRRFIYMVFLTIIAPLVALTYPIDKASDGKAQAFDFWFKEYLFNLFLQPLHLLLYIMLIGMAMTFAAKNPIYVIVCLGFMIPAEKLLKQMFGFKGTTPGSMPGLATGALVMSAAHRLLGHKPPSEPRSSGEGKGGSSDESGEGVKFQPRESSTYDSAMYEGTEGGSGSTPRANLASGQESGNSGGNNNIGGEDTAEEIFNNQYGEDEGLVRAGQLAAQQEEAEENFERQYGNNELPEGQNDSDGVNRTKRVQEIAKFWDKEAKTKLGRLAKSSVRATGRMAKASVIASGKGLARAGRTLKYRGTSSKYWGQRFKRDIRGATRLAGKTAGAIAIGTAGVALGTLGGIASGDLSKGMSYVAAGALAGGKLGSGIGGRTGNRVGNVILDSSTAIKREYDLLRGEAATNAAKMKADIKEWKTNPDNWSYLEDRLGKEHFKKLTRRNKETGKSELDGYLEAGRFDPKHILAGEQWRIANGYNPTIEQDSIDNVNLNETEQNRIVNSRDDVLINPSGRNRIRQDNDININRQNINEINDSTIGTIDVENNNIVDDNNEVNINQTNINRVDRVTNVSGSNRNDNRLRQDNQTDIRQENVNKTREQQGLDVGRRKGTNTRQTSMNSYNTSTIGARANGPSVDDALTVLKMNDEITGGKRFDKQSKKAQDEMRDTMAFNFEKVADKRKLKGADKEKFISDGVSKAEGMITDMGKIQSKIK